MSRFLTELHLRTLAGEKLKNKPFQLLQDLKYKTDVLKREDKMVYILTIPRGYRTDLLTIPRAARWVFSIACKGRNASIPHDYLCHPRDKEGTPIPRLCSSDEAADIFKEALLDLGVGKKKAGTMSWFVRKYGPQFKEGDGFTPKIDYVIVEEGSA